MRVLKFVSLMALNDFEVSFFTKNQSGEIYIFYIFLK